MRYGYAATAASLVWMLLVLPSEARAQDRAPYLQRGAPTEMTVAWRTSSEEPTRVCYGAAPGGLTNAAGDGDSETDHAVRIEGLEPDTRYYYAVGEDSCPPDESGDPGRYFETHPQPGTDQPFRFWVVGDSGTGGSDQAEVRDTMLRTVGSRRPDFFVHVGDMAYGSGTTEEFTDHFFAMYPSILQNTVTWPAMGNHEGRTSDSDDDSGPYYDSYVLPTRADSGGMSSGTESYYSFDYANAHFVALDSHDSSRDPNGDMLTWLESDLASTSKEWIIAFWHHPPYSKGTHDSDNEGALIDMRENAVPILESHGVDLVLTGHSHIYERSYLVSGAYGTPTEAEGNIADDGDGKVEGDGAYDPAAGEALYVVAGHGGTGVGGPGDHPLMYFSETRNGSCIVDVREDVLRLKNIRIDGEISDRVTLAKGDGVIMLAPLGGEKFLAGSEVDVSWIDRAEAAGYDVEYSLDGGDDWSPVAEEVTPGGELSWDSPRRLTNRARIRVTDSADSERAAESGDFSLVRRAERPVIRFGDVWEYNDEGKDLGTDWRTDYGGWEEGPGQLGYGDGDEETEIRNEDPNIPSYYFRNQVEIGEHYEVVGADLDVLFDDGFAVWINGERVFEKNVEDGVDFGTYASSGSDDNDRAETELDLSESNPFRSGENIVAVMVKQRSEGSSDVSFDLSLDLELRVRELEEPEAGDTGTDAEDTSDGPGGGGDAPTGGEDSTVRDDSSGAGASGGDSGGGGCECRAAGAATSGPSPVRLLGLLLVAGVARIWRRAG